MSEKTSSKLIDGVRYVFRPWRTCPRTGRKIWAKEYGLKAWRIPIVEDRA